MTVRFGRCQDFDLTETAVREWVRQAELDAGTRSDGLTSGERDELGQLRRENRRLREDVDILKRAPAPTGLSHWSTRTMADYIIRTVGTPVSHHWVANLWREHGLNFAFNVDFREFCLDTVAS